MKNITSGYEFKYNKFYIGMSKNGLAEAHRLDLKKIGYILFIKAMKMWRL